MRKRARARETEHCNKASVALKTWVDEIMCECLSVWEHIPACNNLLLPLNQAWARRMLCKNTFRHKLKQKPNRNLWRGITWKSQSINNGMSTAWFIFCNCFWNVSMTRYLKSMFPLLWSSQKGCYGNQQKCSSFTISCLTFFITFFGVV